jgi:FKBP-type peptidyl-prolyl cis-trans isomerase FklB
MRGVEMKLQLIVVLGIVFLVSQVSAQEKMDLKNQKEKMSYIIGMDIGNNLKKQSVEVDPNILAKGIRDALAGGKPLLTEQEIRETMAVFQKEMAAKQEAVAQKNKKEGAFLLRISDGVKTAEWFADKVIKAGKNHRSDRHNELSRHLNDGTSLIALKQRSTATFGQRLSG